MPPRRQPWGSSSISFAPDIPVALGSTLDLTFAPGVDVATQSGRTIDLFDWTGVTPTGAFTVSSPYTWNLSNLYTTGEVTLAAAPSLPSDYNSDGTVDAADYVLWRKTLGQTGAGLAADGNGNGEIDPGDYTLWRANFGRTGGSGTFTYVTVPESTTLAMLVVGMLALLSCRQAAVS